MLRRFPGLRGGAGVVIVREDSAQDVGRLDGGNMKGTGVLSRPDASRKPLWNGPTSEPLWDPELTRSSVDQITHLSDFRAAVMKNKADAAARQRRRHAGHPGKLYVAPVKPDDGRPDFRPSGAATVKQILGGSDVGKYSNVGEPYVEPWERERAAARAAKGRQLHGDFRVSGTRHASKALAGPTGEFGGLATGLEGEDDGMTLRQKIRATQAAFMAGKTSAAYKRKPKSRGPTVRR
jgi:hypothetical protein